MLLQGKGVRIMGKIIIALLGVAALVIEEIMKDDGDV